MGTLVRLQRTQGTVAGADKLEAGVTHSIAIVKKKIHETGHGVHRL
jgi:hypothetical protein